MGVKNVVKGTKFSRVKGKILILKQSLLLTAWKVHSTHRIAESEVLVITVIIINKMYTLLLNVKVHKVAYREIK